jgi:mono/diheme cytochrome c family protein
MRAAVYNTARAFAVTAAAWSLLAAPARADEVLGQKVYQSSCAMCHQDQGQGAAGVAPALKGSQWLKLGQQRGYAPGVLLAGMHGAISTDEGTFIGVMPTQNRLSDEEIAAVAGYVVRALNGQQGAAEVTPGDVAAMRAKPASVAELRALRKQALAK